MEKLVGRISDTRIAGNKYVSDVILENKDVLNVNAVTLFVECPPWVKVLKMKANPQIPQEQTTVALNTDFEDTIPEKEWFSLSWASLKSLPKGTLKICTVNWIINPFKFDKTRTEFADEKAQVIPVEFVEEG